jgi:hypothetical protein
MLQDPESQRSRRSLLAAVAAGVLGLVAGRSGRPEAAMAAAGYPVVMGRNNSAGTSNTLLGTASTGTAWYVNQTGTGVAIRGNAARNTAGMFTSVRGTAVRASTANSQAYAVWASGASGPEGGAAILGQGTSESNGLGVYGFAGGSVASNYGVVGQTLSPGAAVHGTSVEGYGVEGASNFASAVYGHGGHIGVYGQGPTYAGYFDGDLATTGTLTKAAGSFRIDHPLDPANMFLFHSFVESPDMLNIYSGTARLDARGEATINLPAYFDALNRDVRYQLTAIGKPAPELHVKSEAAKNKFSIAGGAPGQNVCWLVTGARKDAYAKAHPIQVEVSKKREERGRYLHPAENGAAKSKAITVSPGARSQFRRRAPG